MGCNAVFDSLLVYYFRNFAFAAALAIAVYVMESNFSQKRANIFGLFTVYRNIFKNQLFRAAGNVWVKYFLAARNYGFGADTGEVREREFHSVVRKVHVFKCERADIGAKLERRESTAHGIALYVFGERVYGSVEVYINIFEKEIVYGTRGAFFALSADGIRRCLQIHFEGFYAEEMQFRQLMQYPPAGRMMAIQFFGAEEPRVKALAADFCDYLKVLTKEKRSIQVLGVSAAAIAKVKDIYRYVIYVKADRLEPLIILKNLLEKRKVTMHSGKEIVQYDFDPVNMF